MLYIHKKPLPVIVIVLALSTHSVLEGLAVGLGLSNSDVWTLTIGKKHLMLGQAIIYSSAILMD